MHFLAGTTLENANMHSYCSPYLATGGKFPVPQFLFG